MRPLRLAVWLLLPCSWVLLSTVCVGSEAATELSLPAEPLKPNINQRDYDVIQALLSKIATDPNFRIAREKQPNRTNVVLVATVLHHRGMYTSRTQVESDIDGKPPEDVPAAFQKRNSSQKDDNTVTLTFDASKFKLPVRVESGQENDKFGLIKFDRTFPDAAGYAQMYLPGFSRDGKSVLVRGFIGPWAHGATVTAYLKLQNASWTVEWHKFAWYM